MNKTYKNRDCGNRSLLEKCENRSKKKEPWIDYAVRRIRHSGAAQIRGFFFCSSKRIRNDYDGTKNSKRSKGILHRSDCYSFEKKRHRFSCTNGAYIRPNVKDGQKTQTLFGNRSGYLNINRVNRKRIAIRAPNLCADFIGAIHNKAVEYYRSGGDNPFKLITALCAIKSIFNNPISSHKLDYTNCGIHGKLKTKTHMCDFKRGFSFICKAWPKAQPQVYSCTPRIGVLSRNAADE